MKELHDISLCYDLFCDVVKNKGVFVGTFEWYDGIVNKYVYNGNEYYEYLNYDYTFNMLAIMKGE